MPLTDPENRALQLRHMERLMAMIDKGITEFAFDDATPAEVKPEDQDWDLVGYLKTSLPRRRNAHAHGDAGLTDQVLGTLELVAEILNQPFLPPTTEGPPPHDHLDNTPDINSAGRYSRKEEAAVLLERRPPR